MEVFIVIVIVGVIGKAITEQKAVNRIVKEYKLTHK